MVVRDTRGAQTSHTLRLVAKKKFLVSKAAAKGSECADGDATKWHILSFAFRDMEDDGSSISTAPESMCFGANLAPTYKAQAIGNDCAENDDLRRSLYAEQIGPG